jgi:hypothetical protein
MRIDQPTIRPVGARIETGLLARPARRQKSEELLPQLHFDFSVYVCMASTAARTTGPSKLCRQSKAGGLRGQDHGLEQIP